MFNFAVVKLIIMTQPTYFVEEDKILSALFDEGMDILHINKADSDIEYAERLLTLLPARRRDRIVVHQNYFLKNEYDLRGIHLDNPGDRVPDGFRKHVSRSTSDVADLKEMKKQCDYVMLHSLFDSLHGGRRASLTDEQLRAARKAGLIDRHVYALGGMALENIHVAKEYGFGGVVICGDLWDRFCIHQEVDFRGIIEHFRKLRKAVG